MPSEFMVWSAPSLQRTLPALRKDLPHGLIVPPREVRDEIAALDEKLMRELGFTMNEEARVRELIRQTLSNNMRAASRFSQTFPQCPQPALKQPAHGCDRPIHPLGDFGRRQSMQMAQLDGLPLVVGKLGEGVGQAD